MMAQNGWVGNNYFGFLLQVAGTTIINEQSYQFNSYTYVYPVTFVIGPNTTYIASTNKQW